MLDTCRTNNVEADGLLLGPSAADPPQAAMAQALIAATA
jgi:hypothetical protein